MVHTDVDECLKSKYQTVEKYKKKIRVKADICCVKYGELFIVFY